MGEERDRQLQDALDAERERLLPDTSGEVSDGIPLLADAGEECFALAVMTTDGRVHATEEAELRFSIQSVVKPWIYAAALTHDAGRVHDAIGVEPTGEPFDAVVLDLVTGRPPNPMVNAGAMLASTLVPGADVGERVAAVVDLCSRAAGRPLEVHEETAQLELEHGDRNRALGYLMRSGGSSIGDVEDALRVLSAACALWVSVTDLAAMAATLATWGRQPATGEQVLAPDVVTEVLSVMATCGMYDGAGRWAHRVGLPAKSGVSGGLLAVAPGHLGLGSYSAPLDDSGNSVRGMAACESLSSRLGLHRFAGPRG